MLLRGAEAGGGGEHVMINCKNLSAKEQPKHGKFGPTPTHPAPQMFCKATAVAPRWT